nr:LOW QUALITY PROTEIN: transcriptional repressor NF-X1-like [Rhipicephalus microplus]
MEDRSAYDAHGACGGWDGDRRRHSLHNGGVDFAGTYYYDVNSSQPVDSPPWGRDSERPRERHAVHQSGSRTEQRSERSKQKSESHTVAEAPRRTTQDRSRRKGEPFRFDRRPRNRARVAPNDRVADERGWEDVPHEVPACSVASDRIRPQENAAENVSGQCAQPPRGKRGKKNSCANSVAFSESSARDEVQRQGPAKRNVGARKDSQWKKTQRHHEPYEPGNGRSAAGTGESQLRCASPATDQLQEQVRDGHERKSFQQQKSDGGPCRKLADDGRRSPRVRNRNSKTSHQAGRSQDFSSNTDWQQKYRDYGEGAGPSQKGRYQQRKNDRRDNRNRPNSRHSEHSQTEQIVDGDVREAQQSIQNSERSGKAKYCAHDHKHNNFSSYDPQEANRRHHPSSSRQQYPSRKQGSSSRSYPQMPRPEDAPQKDRLTDQLLSGEYECMVCCERVRGTDAIWSCSSCYHIFHLSCVRKWALSPAALVKEGGWRCPGCQGTVLAVPDRYICFCGKRANPEWNRYGVPHSCGEMCGRSRGASSMCVHRCNLQCHPGQCPPCSATVRRPCPCGKLIRHVRCSQEHEASCGEPCGRLLNCEIHTCQAQCHTGSCDPCARTVQQKCFCGKQKRESLCTLESNASSEFSCGDPCGRSLHCGLHTCEEECHFGECGPCPLLPDSVTHCPCGKSRLASIEGAKPRLSCSDPVPTCGNTCGKLLQCGPKGNWHRCAAQCHEGACPPCTRSSAVRCRCGATSRELPCVELGSPERQEPELCQRRCQKRRQCGRHKCLALCCVDVEHRCPLVCGKRLSCGQHVCEEPCHRGNCPSCWNVSFEDLSCHCGSVTLSPPIACGTRPPECGQPCAREHPCGHPVTHTCHSDPDCPPCATLTEKWCFGHHEKRRAVPCFLEGLSCGRPCQRDLPCGQHQCQQTCHDGECRPQGSAQACTQPCVTPRPSCGHPCGEPCHPGTPCSVASTCKTLVSISCECGRRLEKLPCGSSEAQQSSFHQLSASLLASKIKDIQLGESVDISRTVSLARSRPSRLDCNEECAVLERNRRLANALHIQNADVSNRVGPPCYSEFLKDEARKNPSFMLSVHQTLTQLVQTARQSKQKFRSHCFPSMNREQRRAVHELAEFFGCDTQSYDQEPFRNVVVTAYKDRCRIPSGSVVAVVQREAAPTPQRKGPAPLPQSRKRIDPVASSSMLMPLNSSQGHSTSIAQPEAAPAATTFDYFNFTSGS